MSVRVGRFALALVLTSGMASTAQAQTRQEFGLGAQSSVSVAPYPGIHPSFDHFFVDPGSFSSHRGSFRYRIATESIDWVFVGGGLSGANRFDDSRDGPNLLVGFEILSGRVHRFGELRFTASDDYSARASVGLNVMLGSS